MLGTLQLVKDCCAARQARPPVVDDSIEKDVGRTFPRVKRCAAAAKPHALRVSTGLQLSLSSPWAC